MSITFHELAYKVIKDEKRPLTVSEIWSIAQSKGYDKELVTKGKTPSHTLGAKLYIDVRDNPDSDFIATGERPKKFILRSLLENIGTKILDVQVSEKPQKFEYLEKDIHPFLVYYGFYYLKSYLKTIRHSKSEKKGFGEWVHPDIVGCYFPFSDWKDEVVEVSSMIGNTAIKLLSFELKRELSISNLREAFFQSVSNSSWANESYLAATKIDEDDEFRNELKRLSTSFGIGIVRIDIEDPDSTEVIFPARSKDFVDWETVNKLAGINPDFREFLRRIKIDISSREIRRELYDRVFEKEDLVNLLAKRK
jgi:hypothetical protein